MSANCYVYASMPMTCPLCRVEVPANTPHTCTKRDPWANMPQPPGSKEAAAAAAQLKREKEQQQRQGKRRTK